MRKTAKKNIRKKSKTRRVRRKNQHGGGFSFTGVLTSVILSVGSVFGLKQMDML